MRAKILALLELVENSHQVVESLEQAGHHIVACKDFTQAMEVLQSEPVDLIISDVHLENGGNVFDFLRCVKNNPATRKTPFIMFSSKPNAKAQYIEDGVRIAARVLGATMYMTMDNFDSAEFSKQIELILPEISAATESRNAQPQLTDKHGE